MNCIEIENKEENKRLSTETEIKEKIIKRMLDERTEKIVRRFEEEKFGDNHLIEEIHFKAYEMFSKEVEEHSITFFMHQSDFSGVKIVNLLDNFISNLKKIIAFVQRQLAKKQNANQRKKKIDIFQAQKTQVCERCENLLLQKKVELQKNKILYGQMEDPFNLFKQGKADFEKMMQAEQESVTEENIETLNNEKIVNTQIDKIKDRIMHRTDEIIALISEFKKYEKEDFQESSNPNEKKYFFKKYETCMQEMVSLLKSKFIDLFAKLRIDENSNNKKSVEVQTGNSVNQLIKFYEKQSESFSKDIQIKEKQKEELKRMISELQVQILQNTEEKEQIKQRYLNISEQNSTKVLELQKQQANHKATNKRLSDVTKLFEGVKNQLKEAKLEMAKLEDQEKNLKKKSRAATKIRSKKKKQRNSIESKKNQGTLKQIMLAQNDVENQFELTDDVIIKTTPRSVKKFKFNRRPTLMQNQDSIIENIARNDEEQNSHFTLPSGISFENQENMKITVKQPLMESSVLIGGDEKTDQSDKENNNLLRVQTQKMEFGRTITKNTFSQMKSTKESIFPKMEKRNTKQSLMKSKQNDQMLGKEYFEEIAIDNCGRIPRASVPLLSQASKTNLMASENSEKYRKSVQYKTNKNSIHQIWKDEIPPQKSVSRKNSFLHTENSEDSRKIIHPVSLNKYSKKFNKEIQNFNMSHTLDFLASMKESKLSNFSLTNSFFNSQELPSSYDGSRYEINEVFNKEDVQNLFFSLEEAIEHENSQNKKLEKKNREFFLSLPHNIKYMTRLLAMIARINSKNRSLYEAIKGFLIFPYQSIIAQQNFIFISKSLPSSGKIKEAVFKIISLHRNCDARQKICEHLKKFMQKLQEILEEQN